MNTQDLRAALGEQERFAPDEQAILRELARLRRPDHRRQAWLAGLLAAAAVVAIVVGLTALASHPDSSPGGPTPTATSTSISRPTVTTAPAAELPAQSRERQAAEQARAAAVSAEQAAQAAADGAKVAMSTCSRATSGSVLTAGEVDDRKVTAAADACARAFGARPGYRVEWVKSTLGSVQTLVTGHRASGDRTVVAVQIDGTFVRPGQPAEHETMLLIFFLDGGTPTGVDAPIDPIDLSTLGVVHRS